MSETNPTGQINHIKISKLTPLTEIKDGDKLIIPVSNNTSDTGTPQWASYSVSTSVLSEFIENSLDLNSKFPGITEGTGITVTSTTDELGKTTYTVKNSGVTDVNTTYTLCGVGLDKNSVGTVRISVTQGEVKEGNSSVVTGGQVYTAIDSAKTELIGNGNDSDSTYTLNGVRKYVENTGIVIEAKFPKVTSEGLTGIKVTPENVDGKTNYKLSRSFGMLYYMGYHENLSDLPSTNQKNGDVWSVGSSSNSCSFYMWDGNEWVNMSGLAQNDVDTLKGEVGTLGSVVETLKSNVETLNGKFVQWTYGGNFNVGDEIPVSEFMSHSEVRRSLTIPFMYVYKTSGTSTRQNYLMIWRDLTGLVYSFAFFNGETIVKKVLTLNETQDAWTVTA